MKTAIIKAIVAAVAGVAGPEPVAAGVDSLNAVASCVHSAAKAVDAKLLAARLLQIPAATVVVADAVYRKFTPYQHLFRPT